MKNNYYLKQINPRLDAWQIIDRRTNHPVYDNERDGNDAPLVFHDYDAACEYRNQLNENEPAHHDY